MIICVDTREQAPYSFSAHGAEVRTQKLDSGDYSLAGFENDVAIERKELSDLLGCLTHNRDRFNRELVRLRGYHSAALLIEAPLETIRHGRYRSNITPSSAEQSILSIMERYRLPVYFAKDRTDGENFVFNFLRHFLRHAEEKSKHIEQQHATGK